MATPSTAPFAGVSMPRGGDFGSDMLQILQNPAVLNAAYSYAQRLMAMPRAELLDYAQALYPQPTTPPQANNVMSAAQNILNNPRSTPAMVEGAVKTLNTATQAGMAVPTPRAPAPPPPQRVITQPTPTPVRVTPTPVRVAPPAPVMPARPAPQVRQATPMPQRAAPQVRQATPMPARPAPQVRQATPMPARPAPQVRAPAPIIQRQTFRR